MRCGYGAEQARSVAPLFCLQCSISTNVVQTGSSSSGGGGFGFFGISFGMSQAEAQSRVDAYRCMHVHAHMLEAACLNLDPIQSNKLLLPTHHASGSSIAPYNCVLRSAPPNRRPGRASASSKAPVGPASPSATPLLRCSNRGWTPTWWPPMWSASGLTKLG